MDEIAPSSLERPDPASDLRALASPSLNPLFWPAEGLGVPSAWWQHVPFGRWVVYVTRPGVLVELGTHPGVSYAAFCQAVARSGMDTRCYAVDTWPSDPHPGSPGEAVFEEFCRFHDERYSAFSTVLRTTFDEARARFASGTVDLLHIDGLRTYEAVRHDFESWKPSLSQRAVVLLHSTNERKDGCGGWHFWAELCEQFPHFQFLHGRGLGVLALGKNVDPVILTLCHLSEPSSVAAVRSRFAVLGERCLSQTRDQMLAQDPGSLAIGERAAILRQRVATSVVQAEQAKTLAEKAEEARRDAEVSAAAWEARARESERAREQIAYRITLARRDVYGANLRAEQGDDRAEQAEATARLAQTERDEAQQQLDALLLSTVWRATWPLRVVGHTLPPRLRWALRAGAKLGWWSLSLKLPRKLRERRAALALRSASAATPPAGEPPHLRSLRR